LNTIAAFLIVLFLSIVVSCQTDEALREAKGHVLRSKSTPAVDLEFGKDFKYIGGHKFVLYDVANAEQHFFVDADKDGRVKRLYWIQFEGYLPSNTKTYDYKGTKTVNIDGLDFIADSWARNLKATPGRPDGDGARGRAFIESKGFKLASDDMITQRLLHFILPDRRNELMVIYMEDMSPLGLMAVDVNKGGKAEAKWNEIAAGLLSRAQKGMKIRQK
ncbi:MAG TPA: hypothetical protein VJV05_13340, partial [Pyrinomonadaceae bacterium]|nr:hypothetical protein [Pyrinomonadaceae bacterium]